MNSAAAGEESPHESRTKCFGFGYEKQSRDSPSTQTARAKFLTLILELRPDAISSLFNTSYQPFNALLAENEAIIASNYVSLESEIPEEAYTLRQPEFIRAQAIQALLPNWRSLRQVEGATPLRQAFEVWAMNQNLTEDWCLNHALVFLREFDGADDKNMAFALWRRWQDNHCLVNVVRKSWLWAVHKSCDALGAQFQTSIEFEERGPYSFTFSHESLEFTVSGPVFKSKSQFKQEAEAKFKAAGGRTIRGARKALNDQLRKYLERVAKTVEELGLDEPPSLRWAAEDHFKWLIHYQIPPCMNYRQIGREFHINDKTASQGIQDVARLIGLTVRSSEVDRHLGRPPGAKDKGPRRRVDHRKEKLRGNTN